MEYEVYVKTDEAGRICAVNSSEFLTDTTGWVKIDSGMGDRYHHAMGNYFPTSVFTDEGASRYKLVGLQAQPCTPEEIAAQEAALWQPELTVWDELDRAYREGVDSL